MVSNVPTDRRTTFLRRSIRAALDAMQRRLWESTGATPTARRVKIRGISWRIDTIRSLPSRAISRNPNKKVPSVVEAARGWQIRSLSVEWIDTELHALC